MLYIILNVMILQCYMSIIIHLNKAGEQKEDTSEGWSLDILGFFRGFCVTKHWHPGLRTGQDTNSRSAPGKTDPGKVTRAPHGGRSTRRPAPTAQAGDRRARRGAADTAGLSGCSVEPVCDGDLPWETGTDFRNTSPLCC